MVREGGRVGGLRRRRALEVRGMGTCGRLRSACSGHSSRSDRAAHLPRPLPEVPASSEERPLALPGRPASAAAAMAAAAAAAVVGSSRLSGRVR